MDLGHSPLNEAIRNNDLGLVRSLLSEGADISLIDDRGYTPLMTAVVVNNILMVQLLLEAGADVNQRDGTGEIPLLQAVRGNKPEIARILLAAGADVDVKDMERETALLQAVRGNKPEIARILLDAGADVDVKDTNGETSLVVAVHNGNYDLVKLLLEYGASPDSKDSADEPSTIVAYNRKDFGIVNELLTANADINATSPSGYTLLMYVTSEPEYVRYLIDRGVDVNAVAKDGMTALLALIDNYYFLFQDPALRFDPEGRLDERTIKSLQYLLAAGASATNFPADWDRWLSGLHLPNRGEEGLCILRSLLRARALINTPDPNGGTPLIRAIKSWDDCWVKMLLVHGADPNYDDPLLYLAMDQSADSVRHTEYTRYLLHHGADPRGTNSNPGNLAEILEVAAAKHHYGMIRLLLPYYEGDLNALADILHYMDQDQFNQMLRDYRHYLDFDAHFHPYRQQIADGTLSEADAIAEARWDQLQYGVAHGFLNIYTLLNKFGENRFPQRFVLAQLSGLLEQDCIDRIRRTGMLLIRQELPNELQFPILNNMLNDCIDKCKITCPAR